MEIATKKQNALAKNISCAAAQHSFSENKLPAPRHSRLLPMKTVLTENIAQQAAQTIAAIDKLKAIHASAALSISRLLVA